MPTLQVAAKQLELDNDGFLQQSELWDEEVARALAATEVNGELTEAHWKVINYINAYYKKFGMAPMVRKLCKDTGFNLAEINELFPNGPAKGACKVAGLPAPSGCL